MQACLKNTFTTPETRQSKTLLTIDERRSKSLETVFTIAICRKMGDKWQSKTRFLAIFDLRSSIILTFSIAAYPVCLRISHKYQNLVSWLIFLYPAADRNGFRPFVHNTFVSALYLLNPSNDFHWTSSKCSSYLGGVQNPWLGSADHGQGHTSMSLYLPFNSCALHISRTFEWFSLNPQSDDVQSQ